MVADEAVVQWLLEGDPAIRWQTMESLTDASAAMTDEARLQTLTRGWCRDLLALQEGTGRWSAEGRPGKYPGLYSPKWTSTHYTLFLLRHLGLHPSAPGARSGCRELVEGADWFEDGGMGYFSRYGQSEVCVSAMTLNLLDYFGHPDDDRRCGLLEFLDEAQFDDRGWNCEKDDSHSSFHTTNQALHALAPLEPVSRKATQLADEGREFLLQHRLFRSHRTGRVAAARFLNPELPMTWKYNFLHGLERFAEAGADRDERLSDAIEIMLKKRRKDGRWTARQPGGRTHFRLEPSGPNRWNTLRCLRILWWWEDRGPVPLNP